LSDVTAGERSLPLPSWIRPTLTAAGAAVVVVALLPKVSADARHYDFVEAIQFALLAIVAPALLVLGAPWQLLGLARRESGPLLTAAGDAGDAALGAGTGAITSRSAGTYDDDVLGALSGQRPLDRLASARRRHLGFGRALGYFFVELAVLVAWRTPDAVNALARHEWVLAVEAISTLAAGIGLWLELVESAPLRPRIGRPQRIGLAAITMWTIWTSAYLVGLSNVSVYSAYHAVGDHGLGLASDQELATFILWFVAASAFISLIFWNLITWLRGEEELDEALHRLVRDDRRREWPAARR
jgi:cytochrome c oxidase assembly factor CtaG